MLLEGHCRHYLPMMPQYSLTLKQHRDIRLLKKPNLQSFVAKMNTLKDGPLSDKRIRKALNYLTDVDSLIKYVQKGNGVRLSTFTMPEEFGYNVELTPYRFDFEKARRFLRAAGYPNGFRMKMLVMDLLRH